MFVIKVFSNYQKSIEENVKIFVHLPISSFSSLEVTTINICCIFPDHFYDFIKHTQVFFPQ